jgi:hypothetical protein
MTPLDDYAGVKPEFASVANITEQAGTAAQQLIILSAQCHMRHFQLCVNVTTIVARLGNHYLEVFSWEVNSKLPYCQRWAK